MTSILSLREAFLGTGSHFRYGKRLAQRQLRKQFLAIYSRECGYLVKTSHPASPDALSSRREEFLACTWDPLLI